MKYSGIIRNDLAAAPGISVSFFTQGCPHRCKGCHNPETWDFDGGKEFTYDILNEILDALRANGVKRNLSILGGEPLCPENEFLTYLIIKTVKEKLPDTEIYLWTGYVYEDLKKNKARPHLSLILEQVDVLIDGPYIEAKRDITLPLRGSSNQRIIHLKEKTND
jgi:anaerobic ribonucleoside-triphosphate reductase activating protein